MLAYCLIGGPAPAPTVAHPLVAGSDRFARAFAREATSASPEVPRAERRFETPADFARHASSRNDAIRLAHESGLYTLGEIGRCFGLGPSMVGKVVRARRPTDSLGRGVAAIQPELTIPK